MTKDLKCLKCQGEMVQGFIPDYDSRAKFVSSWVEGMPKKLWFAYTKVPLGGGIPISLQGMRLS